MEAQYSPIQIEEKWSKIWADRELEKPGSEDTFLKLFLRQMSQAHYIWAIAFNTPSWIFTPDTTI